MNSDVNDPSYRLWLGQLKSTGCDVGDRDQVLARHQVMVIPAKLMAGGGVFLLLATLPLLLTPMAFVMALFWPLSLLGAAMLWYGRRARARENRLLALHKAQMGWPA